MKRAEKTEKPMKLKERTAKGEKIGGGWFVFRRHTTSGRVCICPSGLPFEHATMELAQAERLTALNPGKQFCVSGQVVSVGELLAGLDGREHNAMPEPRS